MRRLGLALASVLLAPAAAHARAPFVAEFRLAETGRTVTAAAEREGADVFVDAATLAALGLTAPPGEAPYRLQDINGAAVTIDDAEAAVRISCAAICFPNTALGGSAAPQAALADVADGFFLNTETNVVMQDGENEMAAAFEFGAFGSWGLFENTWVTGARNVRLDTAWTFDNPERRTRLKVGDAFTRGGIGAAPLRFAGVQWGVDFSLDPSFITYPTPALSGQAAAPSVVDVYIDDALRFRSEAPAGPFSIPDAPVVAGAGIARVVITDVLGRQEIIARPFYVSPAMLRAGLADFSLEAGLLREDYAIESFSYGDAFVSGSVSRGMTNWMTLSARADLGAGLTTAGAGLSVTQAQIGQVDLAAAASSDDGASGAYAALGWERVGGALSVSASMEAATEGFRRRGEMRDATQFGARVSTGWRTERFGSLGFAYAARERYENADARTVSLLYAPPSLGLAELSFSLLWTQSREEGLTFGVSLSRPLSDGGMRSIHVSNQGDALNLRAQAQRAPLSSGGLGYRIGVTAGRGERLDAALSASGPIGEARFEVSRVDQRTGLRGRYAFGVTRLGGGVYLTRTIRDAFAVIDVGAPNVSVWHDGRALGRTDLRGRLFAPELRAYDVNRFTIAVDDLPGDAEIANDEATIRPRARAGVVVRMPITVAAAGEARVVDESGAPLPEGAVLTRMDGARFPVGADGRVYLSGLTGAATFERVGHCTVRADADSVRRGAPLVCR